MGADDTTVANVADSFASKLASITIAAKDVAKVAEAPSALNVTTVTVEYILPSEPKEAQMCFLSNLDQNVALLVKTVYVFEGSEELKGEDPAKVLRSSLEKLLNEYWILAGRLTLSPEMKLIVNYNNDGVCFVDAVADAELKDLADVSKPSEQHAKLLYHVPGSSNILDTPLMVAQITKFRCGGWTLGLCLQHSIFDGIGACEFMHSWAETARGLPLSIPPCSDRSILKARTPPLVEFPHGEFAEIEDISPDDRLSTSADLVYKAFTYTPDDIAELKRRATTEGGEVHKCTTFEVLSALVWRARTRALEMEPAQKTRLYFAVNGREKFVPPIPRGYVGNGIVVTFCTTTSKDLVDGPLSHAVRLVQDAIKLIDDRYMRSAIDYFELTRARPATTGSVIVSTWSKLTFHSADFGWGEPYQSGPVTLPDKELILFLADGNERKSMTVLLGLPRNAMARLEESIHL